jgi:UDP-2-acetamido-2,6-beta-L-arabino-hexul-4-ose reductase
MRIVVTGGEGFIGRNLRVRLTEEGFHDIDVIRRSTTPSEMAAILAHADFVYHLAGANRPPDPREFTDVNVELTRAVCSALQAGGRKVPIALSSSTQATLDNPYGRSKLDAERIVRAYGDATGSPSYILRFPNVFGKWSLPNYNSAVATFCYNLARGLPITVNDPNAPLTLLYIDDAVKELLRLLAVPREDTGVRGAEPAYRTTVGDVADTLRSFVDARRTLVVPTVGAGLTRALYATFLSFIPSADFAYDLRTNTDARGTFVEMLKTTNSGQFSFFTAAPGITRGEHYHHTKNEKFLVVQGSARFAFRHLVSGETHEVFTNAAVPRIVETVPGWVHNITNVGASDMIVLLWANEIFDVARPDTIGCKVAL